MRNIFKLITRSNFILFILILIAAFFRFYDLNWGAPYYFHPDERNIASAVSQLTFPTQMNPHFFAYGSLPIYAIYFTGIVVNSIQYLMSNIQSPISNVKFEEAIIISRFFSAIFSVLLILILFSLGKKLAHQGHPEFISGSHEMLKRVQHDKRETWAGLSAVFLATASVGFIQFAHFGTFEMWLTLFSVLLFWLCLQKITENIVLFMGIVLGILVAVKVSSLVLIILPVIAIALQIKTNPKSFKYWLIVLRQILLLLLVSASIYTITNPFVFRDYASFKSSMTYESSVALGTLPVFYTGEFYNATPGIFQFLYVYPFLLNPLITIIFIPAFFYILYRGIKHKNTSFLLLISFFLILFLSQAVLFVKWTRYMIPTLPFIYLIVALTLSNVIARNGAIHSTKRLLRSLESIAMTSIFLISALFAISYFITSFGSQDTRITAKEFAEKNIAPNLPILSEVYDLGIIPFNNTYKNIDLFNFYDLDSGNQLLPIQLQSKLQNAEYIILPSQRLLKIRLNNPKKFPNGYSFYKSLIAGKLGYEELYRTPCDIFCKITYLGDPVFRYEETANVFDRPTVYILKKKTL